jgi:hypothetical protein
MDKKKMDGPKKIAWNFAFLLLGIDINDIW